MTTMADVARVAGVSQTTVSHVLNKTRRVDPATEKAVLAAIESTGYSGDSIARSMRTGRTHSIGLAMSAITNPYFSEVVHAMEREATSSGYTLLLTDTHDDPEYELRALRDLLARKVDGVVLAPSAKPAAAYEQLEKRGIPLVIIDRVPDDRLPGVDAIGPSNVEPVATLVVHLADHGHTRIAIIAPRSGLLTTEERIAGYRLGISRSGLPSDDSLIIHGGSRDDNLTAEAIDRLLSMPNPPTAFVLGNNVITIAAIAALRARGITPPNGIATASFDDFPWADSFHPRLTAMSQPVDELGSTALRMLLERIADPEIAPRHLRLEPEFIIRESCGCPAG